VILVDVNILIYAYDRTSSRHEHARTWLENALSHEEEVAFSLTVILGFLRLMTNPAIAERPLSAAQGIDVVTSWLRRSNVRVASPTDRHWEIFATLATTGQARGPLLMDAHLAALAIEHGALLATTDRDFARFPGLRFRNPLPA